MVKKKKKKNNVVTVPQSLEKTIPLHPPTPFFLLRPLLY